MELTPSELVQPLIEHINRVIAERNKLREENAALRITVTELLEANNDSAGKIGYLSEQVASLLKAFEGQRLDLSQLK